MRKLSIPSLRKKADQVFSLYIRKKYEKDGFVCCITCLRSFPRGSTKGGHYLRRAIQATRYNERNVHPQCLMCNVFKHGELPKYALFLIKTYGPNILEELEIESRKLTKTSIGYYTEIIEKYS